MWGVEGFDPAEVRVRRKGKARLEVMGSPG